MTSTRVFRSIDLAVFGLLLVLDWLAIVYFVSTWLWSPSFSASPWSLGLVVALVVAAWLNHLARFSLLPLMRRPTPLPEDTSRLVTNAQRVAVVTTFVPSQEPLDMLMRTLKAMRDLARPHDCWLLDEGNDARVRGLCVELGINHFTRHNRPELNTEGRFSAATKYGNYNAWFFEVAFARYDIVTTLDPDHVPEPHFLDRVLGYFDDPGIGYVQAAQVYGNQSDSLIARGAAEETYSYYSSVQMAAYALGFPIVTGCHTTHRIDALREVGGFPHHDAEDLLLTQYYRGAGWEGVYVPEVLARGLAPSDWRSYLRQQRRWASSVLDIKLFGPDLLRRLPLRARATGFVHGFNYLGRSFGIVLILLLVASLLATGNLPRLDYAEGLIAFAFLLAATGLAELYRQRFYLLPDVERGALWRTAVLDLAKWPYMLIALFDVLSRRQKSYSITPKQALGSGAASLFLPHFAASLVLGGAWAVGRARGVDLPGVWELVPLLPAVFALLAARAGASPERTGNPTVRVEGAEAVKGEEERAES